jgi:hypothetical protein
LKSADPVHFAADRSGFSAAGACFGLYKPREAIIGSPEERASSFASRAVTTNDLRDVCPNVVLIATSAASRPLAIRIRPIRGMLCRASNVCQRPPTNASNQALKSIGAGSRGHTDVSKIACAISRRDIHASAKRDGEVSEVAAHAPLLGKASHGAPGRIGSLISKRDMRVNEIADRLHPSPAGWSAAKKLPRLIHNHVGLAISAGK